MLSVYLMTQWTFFVLQQIGYKVNIFNENCEVFKLTNPFRPIGIPDTATYLGEAYLGSSESLHAGLKVQHWEDRSTSGKGVVWDLFLQQALLATLLKFLQMLALLCNITSSYVVKCVPVSCVHVEHLSNADLEVVLSTYISLSPPQQGVWFGSFTVAKCIPVQDAFISRDTGFVHLR